MKIDKFAKLVKDCPARVVSKTVLFHGGSLIGLLFDTSTKSENFDWNEDGIFQSYALA